MCEPLQCVEPFDSLTFGIPTGVNLDFAANDEEDDQDSRTLTTPVMLSMFCCGLNCVAEGTESITHVTVFYTEHIDVYTVLRVVFKRNDAGGNLQAQ